MPEPGEALSVWRAGELAFLLGETRRWGDRWIAAAEPVIEADRLTILLSDQPWSLRGACGSSWVLVRPPQLPGDGTLSWSATDVGGFARPASLDAYVERHGRAVMSDDESQAFTMELALRKSLDPSGFDFSSETRRLCSLGPERLRRVVADRVMRDSPDLFNWCERCGGLARTPRARQCPHCLHRW